MWPLLPSHDCRCSGFLFRFHCKHRDIPYGCPVLGRLRVQLYGLATCLLLSDLDPIKGSIRRWHCYYAPKCGCPYHIPPGGFSHIICIPTWSVFWWVKGGGLSISVSILSFQWNLMNTSLRYNPMGHMDLSQPSRLKNSPNLSNTRDWGSRSFFISTLALFCDLPKPILTSDFSLWSSFAAGNSIQIGVDVIHSPYSTILCISTNSASATVSMSLSDVVLHKWRKICTHFWTRSRISARKNTFYENPFLYFLLQPSTWKGHIAMAIQRGYSDLKLYTINRKEFEVLWWTSCVCVMMWDHWYRKSLASYLERRFWPIFNRTWSYIARFCVFNGM